MKNLLYLKNRENGKNGQKVIFKNIETPPAQPSGAAPGSLAERIEKRYNTSLNVETQFNPDFRAVFDDLGKKAQEKNPGLSAESIQQNLAELLAPGKTVNDAWEYLQGKGCRTAAIMDGHLKFFAGPKGVSEISLSELFKPREMKIGEGMITSEYLARRQEMMDRTMQSLQSLRGELPELPKNKTN